MGFKDYDLLEQNARFLTEIGYLSVISVKGPFNGYDPTGRINQFARRENLADVIVGDDAWTGSEYGKVVAVGPDYIHVEFAHAVKPAGVANEDYNPIRLEVYGFGEDTSVEGTTQQNAWQRLASIGVVFTYPVNTNDGSITNPEIEFGALNPAPIFDDGINIEFDFNVDNVTVQLIVDGDPVGSPFTVALGDSYVLENTFVAGDVISFAVSSPNHNSNVLGPITVQSSL